MAEPSPLRRFRFPADVTVEAESLREAHAALNDVLGGGTRLLCEADQVEQREVVFEVDADVEPEVIPDA